MLAPCYIVDQTTLRWPEVHRLVGELQAGKFGFYNLYTSLNLPFGDGYTAAATIGMILFSCADQVGMPLDQVHQRASEVINYALTVLAANPVSWAPAAPAPDAQVPWPVPRSGESVSTRCVQEALGIQERRAKRFLAYVGGERVITADAVEDILQLVGTTFFL